MHQTLYRKYRPKVLADLIGQTVINTILKNQFKSDKLSHAYIFSGPRGTGKTSAAKILASLANCLGEEKACGICVFCKQDKESQLDIIEIDAASNNGVDEIREIKSKVGLVPSIGKYKVYIIDEVHMLTNSAFNALLKTLEEPPETVIFILATTEVHKIPETILSRCQRLDFKRISDLDVFLRLKKISELENIEITDEALEEISRSSKGGMRDAIVLLEQAQAFTEEKINEEDIHKINNSLSKNEIESMMNMILNKDQTKTIEKIDYYYLQGKNIPRILEDIILSLRDKLILEKVTKTAKENYSETLKKINEMNWYWREMKTDPNPKTLLEVALIDLSEAIGKENKQPKSSEKENIKTDKPKEKSDSKPKKPEEPKPTVKENETEEKKEDTDENRNRLEVLKRVRVDNTFSKVSKQFKKEIADMIKNKKVELAKSIESGHLFIDGQIKAASDEHLYFIISFESKTFAEIYNKNLDKMDAIIREKLKLDLKSIGISSDEWEEYRKEFKNKKREYIFKKENGEADEYFKEINQPKNEIEKKFQNFIEKKWKRYEKWICKQW